MLWKLNRTERIRLNPQSTPIQLQKFRNRLQKVGPAQHYLKAFGNARVRLDSAGVANFQNRRHPESSGVWEPESSRVVRSGVDKRCSEFFQVIGVGRTSWESSRVVQSRPESVGVGIDSGRLRTPNDYERLQTTLSDSGRFWTTLAPNDSRDSEIVI